MTERSTQVKLPPPAGDLDPTAQRILQAAAEVFAEQGYAGATTKAIAAQAGVNEVTLFRRFGSKQNLLSAVIEHHSALPGFVDVLERQLTGEYQEDMQHLGRLFHAMFDQRREAVRLMLCEADRVPEVRQVMVQIPTRLRQALARYLRRQQAAGLVRPGDPEVLAQAFLGMFFAYHIGDVVLEASFAADVPTDDVIDCFVDVFVRGTLLEP